MCQLAKHVFAKFWPLASIQTDLATHFCHFTKQNLEFFRKFRVATEIASTFLVVGQLPGKK
jgi:hypothetical protein